jgi:hypothetical protein
MYLTNALKMEHIQKNCNENLISVKYLVFITWLRDFALQRNAFPGVSRSVTKKLTNFETVCILFPST